ncbi:MAG: nuclear transport factor 2 family protein [Myxococcales bacterium]|nr:nuclear transport factor 2 family protein [Myxococcales bacterium]
MGAVEEQNKELAGVFMDALSRADVAKVDELYAEDVVVAIPGTLPFSGTKTKAEALTGMPEVLNLFPDGLKFTITSLTAEGDRVAIEATSEGKTFRGDLYQQSYHFLLRARDGKVVEWKEYMDTDLARRVLVGE